jgi:hypothetical protein
MARVWTKDFSWNIGVSQKSARTLAVWQVKQTPPQEVAVGTLVLFNSEKLKETA